MSKSSAAIANLRGFALLMIVAFHSCMAYLAALPSAPRSFAEPATWMASPILDHNRFIGIDIFCAFVFLHLMQVMFFVSGLFVWRSITQKGAAAFVADRTLRLGLPFLIGTVVLMPLTYYSVFRLTTAHPDFGAFIGAWLALPIWPSGPMWFLYFLLALDVAVAAVAQLRPERIDALSRLAASLRAAPASFFVALVAASAALYLPLAQIFTPWDWRDFGPFAIQPLLGPQYALYFFAGVVGGAGNLDRGILDADGSLARQALRWAAAAGLCFVAWLAAMGIVTQHPNEPAPAAHLLADVSFVLFAATASLTLLGWFLRTAGRERPLLAAISRNGYGVYFFHYFFVLWTQYLLLGVDAFAPLKAFAVWAVSLTLSWGACECVCMLAIGRHILRGQRPMRPELRRPAE